ncbi:MAG: glycosyltransferase [Parabacteroides sp.]
MIHEAACSGLPILASGCCGAVSCFVKDGENGFLFTPGDKRAIRQVIERFIHLPEPEWLQMGKKSRELSYLITPSVVAERILTLLK